ncbi:hypothetical protein BDB01DRAFT_761204, partial [Pilobolus umbonatus]
CLLFFYYYFPTVSLRLLPLFFILYISICTSLSSLLWLGNFIPKALYPYQAIIDSLFTLQKL